MTTMHQQQTSAQREVRIALSIRATATIVGVLFLSATASFIVGEQLIAGVLRAPDTLAAGAAALALGALFAFIDGVAVVGIAALLFPVLRRVSEPLALGYLGLRVTEFAAILLYVASPLYVPALARGVTDGVLGASVLQGLGPTLQAAHAMALQLIYLLNGIAGSLLAVLLYQSRLVPRGIAAMGLIGYPVLLVGTVLAILGVTDLTQGAGLLAVVPGALFELVLPIWLVARGFAHSDAADEPEFVYPALTRGNDLAHVSRV